MELEAGGFKYDSEQVRGYCSKHAGPFINVPAVSKAIRMSTDDRALLEAGLWGIGYCPVGKHFEIWTASDAPPSGEHALLDYLRSNYKINLDNFEDLI